MPGFDELKKRAGELGIPTNSGVYKPKTEAWSWTRLHLGSMCDAFSISGFSDNLGRVRDALLRPNDGRPS
jgi:hypothetical protein